MSDKETRSTKEVADLAVDALIESAKARQAESRSKEEIPEEIEELSENDIKYYNFIKNLKIMGIILIIMVILGILLGNWASKKIEEDLREEFPERYQEIDPTIDPDVLGQLSPTIEATEEPGIEMLKPVINIKSINFSIDLFKIITFLIFLFTLLEAFPRGPLALLTWIMVPIVLLLLIFRWEGQWWLVSIMVSLALMLAFMVIPLIQRKKKILENVDLTNFMLISSVLIIIWFAGWRNVSYPYYIHPSVIVTVFIISFVREMAKTIWVSLVSVVFGVIMGWTLNPWVIFTFTLIGIVLVILEGTQTIGFSLSKRRNITDPMGEESVLTIWPWDVFLGMLFSFAITAYLIYGNFIIFSF